MHKLAIVIPAHNEEKRIAKTLDAYISYFSKTYEHANVNIIVVLNACTDRTKNIVSKYKQKNFEFIEFAKGGKGFAVIEGFKYALELDYNYIGFVDADMATTPQEFDRLFSKIENYDGVIANRYLKGAKLMPRNTLPRIMASRLYNFFIRSVLIIPFTDTQCGAKIFKTKPLSKVINNVGMTSWAFDIELLFLLKKAGFRIREFPTVWSNRDYAKINFWKSGPWMAFAVIRLRILNSPFRSMIRIYDKFIRVFKPAK